MYTIAVIKDRTTIYKKVPYDCLSYKQKLHNGIIKYNINNINNINTNTKSLTVKAKPIILTLKQEF
jgi:hypothetical protein